MNPVTIPVESARFQKTNEEIDEANKFDEEDNMVAGIESEHTTQNNNGEDGWVFNCLADFDMY